MQGVHKLHPKGKDTAHGIEEFGDFPWGQLTCDECGLSYGGITDGMDFSPRKAHITFCFDDGFVDAWEVPEQLEDWLKKEIKRGYEMCQKEIKQCLGI